jgi:hypothetical protein
MREFFSALRASVARAVPDFMGRVAGTPRRVRDLAPLATRVFFVLRTQRSPLGRQGCRPTEAVARELWGLA